MKAVLVLAVFACCAIAASAIQIAATSTATGWSLYGGQQVTYAQVDKMKSALNTPNNLLPSEYYFWHWTTWNTCIRRTATQISSGEMNFLVDNDAGMVSGGGLYLARTPDTSSNYGPCPLNIVIKAGTAMYNQATIQSAGGITISNDRVKSSIGTVVPFVHNYNTGTGWWVTHNVQNIARVELGVRTWSSIPWWSSYANKPYLVRPPFMNALQLWETIDGSDGIVSMMKKDMGVPDWDDRFNSLSWLRSFYILMQYIDGPSLVRAIRLFPSDPWSVFEPQKFGFYRDAWLAFVNGRVQNPAGAPYAVFGYTYNIAQKSRFGDNTGAATWSARQVKEVLPNLAKLLSGSSAPFSYRSGEVRAGGDETGQTFIATAGQVRAMQSNPYLVVNAVQQPSGSYLVYYYYPDPMHLNPALQSRVSAALWTKMKGTTYSGKDDPAFKTDCAQLINELLVNTFSRHYGADIGYTTSGNVYDGLSLILDLVSIHPFLDYNGRTTRFYLCAAMFEGAYKSGTTWYRGDAPVAFISDFDLVSTKAQYANQLIQATTAAGNLRIQMLAEWGRSLNPRYGMADHFRLDAWQIYQNEALAWAGAGGSVNVNFNGDSDFEMIRKRQWVPLMDSKFGTNWPGRN